MSYTPGPWKLLHLEGGKRGSGEQFIIMSDAAPAKPIACGLPVGDENTRANYRLIEAAPDLLEACILFQKWNREVGACDNCVEQESCCERHEEMIQHACVLSKSAIAKATGK